MTLNNRISIYFKYHIFVKIRMSPSPSTAKEVHHLYENFKKVGGSLEYFKMGRGKPGLNIYSNEADLIFNPSSQLTQLDPFNGVDKDVSESRAELLTLQNKLSNKIRSICAIPRYSFIANDTKYMNGEIEIPYKYRLNRNGLKYENQYSLTSSTIDDQFSYVSPIPEAGKDEKLAMNDSIITDFKSNMRHNFQKFHKFDTIVISDAIPKINQLIQRQKLNPHVKHNMPVSYSDIIDLKSKSETEYASNGVDLKLQRLTQGFRGFYDLNKLY